MSGPIAWLLAVSVDARRLEVWELMAARKHPRALALDWDDAEP